MEVDGSSGSLSCWGRSRAEGRGGRGTGYARAGAGLADAWRSGRQCWPGSGRCGTTGFSRGCSSKGAERVELEMTDVAQLGNGKRLWRELRSNPDYLAEWRAHAGEPTLLESAPCRLRRRRSATWRRRVGACRHGIIRECTQAMASRDLGRGPVDAFAGAPSAEAGTAAGGPVILSEYSRWCCAACPTAERRGFGQPLL